MVVVIRCCDPILGLHNGELSRCKLLLMAYRSTVADDDALLADPKISWHKRCAVQLRRSEKLMLSQAAEMVALRGLDEEL